jgi:hypothetical protein
MNTFLKSILLLGCFFSLSPLFSQSDSLIRQVYARWSEDRSFQRLVPTDDLFLKMGMETESNWQEVDRYYQYYFSDSSAYRHYEQEKTTAFFILCEVFKMPEKAPIETVEYYLHEQMAVEYTYAISGIKACLKRMRGHWTEAQIQKYAEERYLKTKQTCTRSDGQLKPLWYEISLHQEKLLLPH